MFDGSNESLNHADEELFTPSPIHDEFETNLNLRLYAIDILNPMSLFFHEDSKHIWGSNASRFMPFLSHTYTKKALST